MLHRSPYMLALALCRSALSRGLPGPRCRVHLMALLPIGARGVPLPLNNIYRIGSAFGPI